MKKLCALAFVPLLMWACSATGEEQDFEPTIPTGPSDIVSSSSAQGPINPESSSSAVDAETWKNYFKWVDVSEASLTRGSATYSVDAFAMTSTEVGQGVYKLVMGNMPQQEYVGDDYPIENVSWFQAVLFCNAYAKKLGLDTAYQYSSIKDGNVLDGLVIDYSVETVRLPTETEWEVAARGGTSTTYYWDTEVASKYAYYAQTKGPVEMGQYVPNAYGLYDMGGNVAEWVNDWYQTYSTTSQKNPIGPASGEYRCIRGGGWTDKVTALASGERNKKNPKYTSASLGFRLVYSNGFSK